MKFGIRNLKFGIIAAALLFLNGCEKPTLPPGRFTADAKLSGQELKIGDIVTLTLMTRHPNGSIVKFPIPGKGKEVVVRERSVDTRKLTEEILETETVYHLTSLRTGNWLVTTDPAICTFADGTQKTNALPTLTLHVQSALDPADINSLSDIKGPVKPPLRISPKLWVPLLIALMALLAGVITLLFMKKRSHSRITPKPIIPPHIKARNALASLKEKPWMPEPFFVDLSLILRTYLEGRFNLNAPESTTEELAGKLNHENRLALKDQNTMREFFVQADLVKFARAGAEQDVMRTAFSTVEAFVDQTAECPTPNEEPQNEEG